jgi:hypothetical protein
VLGTWRELDPAGHIEDPALEVPLPIDAIIHAAKADDAVARALVARHNPVIEAVRAEDRAASRAEGKLAGKIEGKIEALVAILTARDIALNNAARERILREQDPQRLDRWIARAAVSAVIAEVLTEE